MNMWRTSSTAFISGSQSDATRTAQGSGSRGKSTPDFSAP
jgi:hypothetical protein